MFQEKKHTGGCEDDGFFFFGLVFLREFRLSIVRITLISLHYIDYRRGAISAGQKEAK